MALPASGYGLSSTHRHESNRLTGGTLFVEEIERRTGIRLEFKRLGPPAKEQKITH
jgi:hypothetical protein